MRNIFALITFLFISSFVFAQEQTQRMVLGRCNLSQTGGSTNHWRLSGNFTDGAGLYESSDINVGDKVFFTDGGIGFLLPIDTVVSATPPSFTISVNKTGITAISSVPTTNSALICRGTSNHGLIPFTANVTDPDNQVLMEHTLYLIDSLLSLSGGGIDSTHVYGDTTFAYAGIDSFVVSIDQNAAEVPLAPQINFGGVLVDTVQEALEAIDARLDTAWNKSVSSSSVRNDSVFHILLNGAEIYSGIDKAASSDGRILYVTKNGNDGTAVIGNYFKPFLTIQGALDNASAGDLIVVYPGVYSEATNLGAKKLNYNFIDGSVCNTCFISGANDIGIFGQGDFVTTNFLQPTNGVSYNISADSIYAGVLSNESVGNINLSARVVNTYNAGVGHVKAYSADTTNFYNINIKIGFMTSLNFLIDGVAKRYVTYEIDRLVLSGSNAGIHSTWTRNLNNLKAVINAKVVTRSGTVTSNTGLFYYDPGSGRNCNNFSLTTNIEYMETNSPFFFYVNASTSPVNNSFYAFNIKNCIYTDTLSLLFDKSATWPRNSGALKFYFSGNYYSSGGGMLDITNTTAWNIEMHLSGNYTTATKEPFSLHNYGTGKLYFENAKIICPSAKSPFKSISASQNVYLMNTFTNSTTINANIIENIQPIIRHSNVK